MPSSFSFLAITAVLDADASQPRFIFFSGFAGSEKVVTHH
jgi:hypothetical protein